MKTKTYVTYDLYDLYDLYEGRSLHEISNDIHSKSFAGQVTAVDVFKTAIFRAELYWPASDP